MIRCAGVLDAAFCQDHAAAEALNNLVHINNYEAGLERRHEEQQFGTLYNITATLQMIAA